MKIVEDIMGPWRLLDYLTDEGRNPFQEWYAGQQPEVQAALDATVLHLRATHDWLNPPRKTFQELRREHAGMHEIRFWPYASPARKFRVVGLYRLERREFIFLGGCEKQLGLYIPRDAFDVARQYKQNFEAGRGTVCDHV